MSANLLIVESPAKAKTIENILGEDFTVRSCFGHIRDLSKKNNGVDVDNGFQPIYEVPADKKAVVRELKKLAGKAEVWLATDEDREGEAISWHLCKELGLDPKKTKRIVFHEITEPAIKRAVQSPRTINLDLVNAQQARRILDRLVGFELSPLLWKKVRRGLSAGRVQSVAVRLVVEREREIQDFQYQSAFRVLAYFVKDGTVFKAELGKRFTDEAAAREFLEACRDAVFTVQDVQVKPLKKSPAPPFTTSTLQQEASRKLGFSVSRTMSVAQKLYESGKITYMRTDSVNLSRTAMDQAARYIMSAFGEEYSEERHFTSKNASAQEAHEAIRPTYLDKERVPGSRDEQRLYELIWKRTVASQMAQARLEKTRVQIGVSTRAEEFAAEGEVLKFPGFLKVYMESRDDDDAEESDGESEGMLPAVTPGETLNCRNIQATQRFNRPPARYTEASLVKKLEELQIGRPSTYAPTISTIQNRGYVEKGDRDGVQREYRFLELQGSEVSDRTLSETYGAEKAKLFPTDIGILVNDFLMEHFTRVMDFRFTAKIEEEFDDIAENNLDWQKMLEAFYGPFHQDVEKTTKEADHVTGERALGDDPESGRPVIAKLGKYGPMVQLGQNEDEEKPRFSKLLPGQSIETITLEEALELFKLPRNVGEYEGEEIKANIGRFGPYVLHNNKFYSLRKEQDPYTIAADEAIALIEEKREQERNRMINDFPDSGIQVLNGRYGPYIKQGKNNYKIPKGRQAAELTEEDCQAIIAEAPEPRPKGKRKKT